MGVTKVNMAEACATPTAPGRHAEPCGAVL